MRIDFCLASLSGLSPDSPPLTTDNPLTALREAGFGGVQTDTMQGITEVGLVGVGSARCMDPATLDTLAREHKAAGFICTTLIVGAGLENDAQAARYADALLNAQARHGHTLLLETHRASITQDMRRTLDLVTRFPELRFTADFTHWYLGHELQMGDYHAKLAALQPVIDRVAMVEGRIGSVNCAQIPLESADDNRHFVKHHREFWTRCFSACLRRGEEPVFAPQLLPASIHAEGQDWSIDYSRLQRDDQGQWREESDRWQQTLLHCAIARECYTQAKRLKSSNNAQ